MQERQLFEYAVIRFVPRVEREEFLNVGVILLCKQRNFLQVRHAVDPQRLSVLCPGFDWEELAAHLQAFARIAAGDASAGPIAQLDVVSRFRWLTAQRSTVIQSSKVHPGLCCEPADVLGRLFNELVG